ncbi:MAG: NADH-quinone oxidoreductase subunit K [Pseudomonadota bacterium]
MTATMAYATAGIGLFVLGLYALSAYTHLLRKVIALNIMASGIFLVFGAIAHRAPGQGADPVPHALVITGVVVAVSATALALALMLRIQAETGQPRLPDETSD